MAREVGFDLAGIAPCAPPPDAARFEEWLARGHHAGLDYLVADRERILDPRRLLPEGRSILVVGLAHSRPAVDLAQRGLPGGGRVARYAAGRDYHNRMLKLLRKLARRLKEAGLADRRRPVADAGPVLERSHAARAGLGFLSKAANLLHPRFGPWFFLGELLLDAELAPTSAAPTGSCGTCRACIDACPTGAGAILEPGRVDAGLCISYHTIESRELAPRPVRERMGPWAFGCDVCSEVCPWGKAAPDLSGRWGDSPSLVEGGLLRWLAERDPRPPWADATPLRRPGTGGTRPQCGGGPGAHTERRGPRRAPGGPGGSPPWPRAGGGGLVPGPAPTERTKACGRPSSGPRSARRIPRWPRTCEFHSTRPPARPGEPPVAAGVLRRRGPLESGAGRVSKTLDAPETVQALAQLASPYPPGGPGPCAGGSPTPCRALT
jgi:epoxyqueuosine reductase